MSPFVRACMRAAKGWRSLVTLNKFFSRASATTVRSFVGSVASSAPRGASAKLIRDPAAIQWSPNFKETLGPGCLTIATRDSFR